MTENEAARPWDATERPDEATVKAILEAQFPALGAACVRYLAEGWDFTVFAIGDDKLVRFPKREATLPWLDREFAVLDALADHDVPASLPSNRFVGEPSVLYPFPFVGYTRLPGVPLDTLALGSVREDATRRIATVVGVTLQVLHELPLDVLPPAPSPRDEMTAGIATALEVLTTLEGQLPAAAVTACRARLEAPPPTAPRRVVTHGDLGPEHLLVDSEGEALTGIIDWSDAGPWDAAADFVGLWVELGEVGLRAALAAYGSEDDAHLAERVRFHGTRWLLNEVRVNEQGWRPEIRDRSIRRIVRVHAS